MNVFPSIETDGSIRLAKRHCKYAASHSVYISAAKANRIAENANPFKAYRLNEIAPRVGDLICRSRAGSGATYDTIHPGMTTHCDIVTAVKPGALTVIGGNVDNSVKRRIVHTDSPGRVTLPLAFDRRPECRQYLPGRRGHAGGGRLPPGVR